MFPHHKTRKYSQNYPDGKTTRLITPSQTKDDNQEYFMSIPFEWLDVILTTL